MTKVVTGRKEAVTGMTQVVTVQKEGKTAIQPVVLRPVAPREPVDYCAGPRG